MPHQRHFRHYHRHFGFSYPSSLIQRFYSAVLPLVLIGLVALVLAVSTVFPPTSPPAAIFPNLVAALIATFSRLIIAYVLALVIAIPLALAINHNQVTERILLPLFDITQSVPVLAFFPIIVLLFIQSQFFDGAAIAVLFLSMLWNIVFSIVGGLRVIPGNIKDAAKVMELRGLTYLRRVTLPALFPYLVTGSLLAWAQGWNLTIVAEVLHPYIPGGTPANDLFGIGSIIVNAVATGRNDLFFAALAVMVAAIAFLNFFVWQRLLRQAERYRFE